MGLFAETGTVNPIFQRLTLLTGAETASALEKSGVMVVGLGGVGSWAAEALVRSGVGRISLVDFDTVCVSNINRQLQALNSNLGRLKTEALGERLKDINPSCEIKLFPVVFSKETSGQLDINGADFVIDAIDTLESKLDLIELSLAAGKRLFSSMGMAQKLDPTLIRTADIWQTSGCPLARLVRQGLRKRGISGHFKAVYSPERLPLREELPDEAGTHRKAIGSAVSVTATAGMVLASLVIRDLMS